MAISMVRKPSETPNINNIDDIIPFRYAYGNQNGYVIGRGAEVSHTVNGNQFTINSGRLVIQGVESDIDANGVTLTINPVSETRYYVIYHEINLATNTANIKVQFDTTTYPTINEGDDLTQNSSGIANLILYKFIAQNGEISSVEKVVKSIDYTGTALVGYDNSKGTVENRLIPLNNYDNSKGTVEERLSALGFKEANIVTFLDVGNNQSYRAGTINLKRQGNYILVSFGSDFSIPSVLSPSEIEDKGKQLQVGLSSFEQGDEYTPDFYPKEDAKIIIYQTAYVDITQPSTFKQIPITITFYTDGTIYARIEKAYLGINSINGYLSFRESFSNGGYEGNKL